MSPPIAIERRRRARRPLGAAIGATPPGVASVTSTEPERRSPVAPLPALLPYPHEQTEHDDSERHQQDVHVAGGTLHLTRTETEDDAQDRHPPSHPRQRGTPGQPSGQESKPN